MNCLSIATPQYYSLVIDEAGTVVPDDADEAADEEDADDEQIFFLTPT